VLILAVIQQYEIEATKSLFPVLCLAVAGFVVHVWLPRRFRITFFVLLSLGAILFVLGWPQGAWGIVIGAGLIALCYLPVPLPVGVLLPVAGGVGLVSSRWEPGGPFWPLLASIFIFRLIVSVFEIRHERGRPPLGLTLAYFFPLPNVCFTLF